MTEFEDKMIKQVEKINDNLFLIYIVLIVVGVFVLIL